MDVSSTYARLFSAKKVHVVRDVWGLLRTVYRVGKLVELSSFALWESLHRTKLFPARRYLTFTPQAGMVLTDTWLANPCPPAPCATDPVVAIRPAAINWKWVCQAINGTCRGCLSTDPTALYALAPGEHVPKRLAVFDQPITGLHVTRRGVVFVCSSGVLYYSTSGGHSFAHSLTLTTPVSYFLFNNSMTELPDGRLLFGEYASVWRGTNWQNLAYLFISDDAGATWTRSDFLIRQGINKHIHLIKYSSLLNAVVLTDGDNKKKIWINDTLADLSRVARSGPDGWRLVNRRHRQLGGYTAMAEGTKTILLGTDYLGGTNFIVSTRDGYRFTKRIIPDPFRRSPIMNMVNRRTAMGLETWAVLHNSIAKTTRCLLMYTRDEGQTWHRVLDYDGTRYELRLISSGHEPSATIYLLIIAQTPAGERTLTYAIGN